MADSGVFNLIQERRKQNAEITVICHSHGHLILDGPAAAGPVCYRDGVTQDNRYGEIRDKLFAMLLAAAAALLCAAMDYLTNKEEES